ncbi:MAG: hypothetical protein WC683_08065 [bacterium]
MDYNQQAQIAYLSFLANLDASEQEWVRTCRDYAEGNHPLYITERMKEFMGLKARNTVYPYAHNMCQLVIDCICERLSVEGWEAGNEGDGAENDMAALAPSWWTANGMDTQQDNLYAAAARDASSYIIVDWDAGRGIPGWYQNDKYDGTQGVAVYTDPNTGAVVFAAKKWQVSDPYTGTNNGRTRMNLFFADRVEKYISAQGSNRGVAGTQWEPFQDVGDTVWPIPWRGRDGAPLGCAVVPFDMPGGSVLTPVIPIQDMLNKADLDLIATTDSAGFRILWAAGMTPSIDSSTGEEKAVNVGPGYMMRFTDPAGKLGALDPVDPALMIRSCHYWIESAAGITRVPQYLLQMAGADQPSGESLKQQEVGLVARATRCQEVFGAAWQQVMALSARLYDVYNPPHIPREIAPMWKDASLAEPGGVIRQREAETLQAYVQAGMPLEAALKELGWDDERIAEVMDAKKRESEAQQVTLGAAMARAQRHLDQNQPPTPGLGSDVA